jgi:iron complex transport system substrate-binding protein
MSRLTAPVGLAVIIALMAAGGVAGARLQPVAPTRVERPDPQATTPTRIASTSLPIDEVLLALVPVERVLVVNEFADKPDLSNIVETARRVPHRAEYTVERLLTLRPDLVLAPDFAPPDVTATVRAHGLRVVNIQDGLGITASRSLDDLKARIGAIGAAVGEPARAAHIVAWIDHVTGFVAARVAGVAGVDVRPKTLWYAESLGYVAGTGFFGDELIRIAGGVNAAVVRPADQGGPLVGMGAMTTEQLLALDASIIALPGYRALSYRRDVLAPTPLAERPLWRHARAVREGQVVTLPAQTMLSFSHHVVRATVHLGRVLHPARFADIPADEALWPAHLRSPEGWTPDSAQPTPEGPRP